MKKIPPTLQLRRDLVQALIQFANKTQGGTWSLVNCVEGERFTMVELESDYVMRDIHTGNEPPVEMRRFRLTVEPVQADSAEPQEWVSSEGKLVEAATTPEPMLPLVTGALLTNKGPS